MRNILIFNGSPRKRGNTADLAEHLNKLLTDNGCFSTTHRLYDLDIGPCIDCRACKKNELRCAMQDDMQPLYEYMERSDIIIFATPIYWFGPTAKMKLLIDRLRPYYANRKLEGRKAALILPAGSGAADCDLTIEMFKRVFKTLNVSYLGEATAEAYDKGEAVKNEMAIKGIEKIAEEIISAD